MPFYLILFGANYHNTFLDVAQITFFFVVVFGTKI